MHRLPTAILVACWLSIAAFARAAETAPPNLVVFLVDDMGVMDTSLPFLTNDAGEPVRYPLNDYYRTPNMERLAARGVRFSNFYAMSVCSPTRISIMTGQNAARHRATNWMVVASTMCTTRLKRKAKRGARDGRSRSASSSRRRRR